MALSITSITKLLRQDPSQAEEQFNKLALADQAELFLRAGDRDRLRLVELAHESRKLLEFVPAMEIWLTIKRLTPADSLSLIKYATPEQLQVVSDIEWWKKDKLSSSSVYEWLEYISACGIDKMVEWFTDGDWDQILWFFKQSVVVFKREDKEVDPADAISWPREEAPITHEGVYYFQVLDEGRDEVVRRFLEILVKHERDLYSSICEACIWDIPSMKEEEAYQVRARRLAEHGLPSFDEAIGIYSPLSRSRFKSVAKRDKAEEVKFAPRYPLAVLGDKVLFVNRVLSETTLALENRFLLEIAGIANKLLVADGEDPEPERLNSSLTKAMGYINIGLEVLSGGDISAAVSLIEGYWLTSIFQVGLGEVAALSRDMQKIFKKSWMRGDSKSLSLMDPGQRVLVTYLLLKRPKYFVGGGEFAKGSIRDFVSSEELLLARQGVRQAEFVGRILEKLFLKKAGSVFELVDYPEELRFTGIMLTVLVNGVLNGNWVFKPVKTEKLLEFLKRMNFSGDGGHLEGAIGKMRSWVLSQQKGLSREEEVFLDKFIELSRGRLVGELKDITEPPKPRFVHCVWLIG